MPADLPICQFFGEDLYGQEVGPYRIERALGGGGFGQVFGARRRDDGSRAAVKIMRPAYVVSREAVKRFEREAACAARLEHPNIVRIFDFGAWRETMYFAMEWIEGQSLWDLVEAQGPLPESRALEIITQCAHALAHAHKAGVIHRDIKPGNIMIAAGERVKLVDFGLAKDLMATAITKPGARMGTFQYMTPEQLRGDPVDLRCDLYGLGLLWWQMLTAKMPFPAGDIPFMIEKRKERIALQIARLRSDVSGAALEVMDRLLSFYPAGRYPDAERLVEDLARLAAGQPIPPLPPLPSTSILTLSREEMEALRSGRFPGSEDPGPPGFPSNRKTIE